MKIINPTLNPFVNIALNIANSKYDFDKSSFQLIDFLLENHSTQFDINEPFDIKRQYSHSYSFYKQENEINTTNFFNEIFILNNSFNPQLINRMVDCGFKINPFLTNENKEVIDDVLFTKVELNEKRNIFLFNLYLKQNGIADFTKKIVEHNTLHKAVNLNKLDLCKFLLEHVSINLCNKDLDTPIMFAKNLDTLNFLDKYNPDWSKKNVLKKDCSYYYSQLEESGTKKNMMDFYLNRLSKNFPEDNEDNVLYIQKRLEESLLNLVVKDATKAEIQTFLKTHKLKNADIIKNIEKTTLGHICVINGKYARLDLFPKTDIYNIDKKGRNMFTTLFGQTRISSKSDIQNARKILLRCLEDSEKNITEETFNELLELPLKKYTTEVLPNWIFSDYFLKREVLKTFKISEKEINIDYITKNQHGAIKIDEIEIYFDLLGNLMKKYKINILEKENVINLFFNNNLDINNNNSFNKDDVKKFLVILHKCESIGKLEIEDFFKEVFTDLNSVINNMKNNFIVENKEIYETSEELKKASENSFFEKVLIPFFKFLQEENILNIIKILDNELVNEVLIQDTKSELNDFSTIFTYLKINDKLEVKKTKIKKTKI